MAQNPIAEQLEVAQSEVVALREQIARLTRQYEIAKARLDAFQIASQAFDDAAPKIKGGKIVRTRNRLPNSDWQAVFQTLYREFSDGFGYDEIYNTSQLLGIDAKRASLRTKLMNYANEGHVERIDNGRFAITRKGLGYFKIDAVTEPAATDTVNDVQKTEVTVTTPINPPLEDSRPNWMR